MENLTPYQTVLKKIEAACEQSGRIDRPELIAVSKFQSADKVEALYLEGQRLFGENYVQELVEKKIELERRGISDLEFHFIGRLQSNKVKLLLPHVSTIHSVDSLKLLKEIEKQAKAIQKQIQVYFQINIDEESSKGGFTPEMIPLLFSAEDPMTKVKRVGWMCIPDPDKDPAKAFHHMKEIAVRHASEMGTQLSMGMSDDYELAIQKGATALRIGSALFGSRG